MSTVIKHSIAAAALLTCLTLQATNATQAGEAVLAEALKKIATNPTLIKNFGNLQKGDDTRPAKNITQAFTGVTGRPFLFVDSQLTHGDVNVLLMRNNQRIGNIPVTSSSPNNLQSLPEGINLGFDWISYNTQGNPVQTVSATVTGNTSLCLSGHSVMLIQQQGTSSTINVSCYNMPPCGTTGTGNTTTQNGVITSDDRKVCDNTGS